MSKSSDKKPMFINGQGNLTSNEFSDNTTSNNTDDTQEVSPVNIPEIDDDNTVSYEDLPVIGVESSKRSKRYHEDSRMPSFMHILLVTVGVWLVMNNSSVSVKTSNSTAIDLPPDWWKRYSDNCCLYSKTDNFGGCSFDGVCRTYLTNFWALDSFNGTYMKKCCYQLKYEGVEPRNFCGYICLTSLK